MSSSSSAMPNRCPRAQKANHSGATLGRRALLAQLVEHLHGKEGVDGSSPSEGLINVPANWHITVVCPLNTRTQNGHIRGTRDAARPFATPADTLSQVRSRAHHRGSTCLEAITRCLNRRGRDPLSP